MRTRTRRLLVVLTALLLSGFGSVAVVRPASAAQNLSDITLQFSTEFYSAPAGANASVAVTASIWEVDQTPGPNFNTMKPATFGSSIQIAFDVESLFMDGHIDPTAPDDHCTIQAGGSSCSRSIPSGGKSGGANIRAWIDVDKKDGKDGGRTEADRVEGRYASDTDNTNPAADDCVGPTDSPSNSACRGETAVPGDPEGDQTDVARVSFFVPSSPRLNCVQASTGRSGSPDAPLEIGQVSAGTSVTFQCSALNASGGPMASVPIDGEMLAVDGSNPGPNDPDQGATPNTAADYNSQNPANPLGDAGCLTNVSGVCSITIPGKITNHSAELGIGRVCFWGDNTGSLTASNGTYTDGGAATDGGQCKGTITSLTDNAFISWQEAVGLDVPAETQTVARGGTVTVTADVYNEAGTKSFASPKPTVYVELFSGSAGDGADGNSPGTPDFKATVPGGATSATIQFPANTAGNIVLCAWTATPPVMTGKVNGTGADVPSCSGTAGAEGITDATGDSNAPSPANDNTDIVTRTVTVPPPPPDTRSSGYWLLENTGRVVPYNATDFGSGGVTGGAVGIAAKKGTTPGGDGYWIAGADGSVAAKGATNFGNATGTRLNAPIVGIAARPQGDGYWLLGRDGGIFTFGPGAKFWGSTGNIRLNAPVVGIASTPSGNGYWLVASDGGVFAFGDAAFNGSMGSTRLNKPVVGMTAPSTGGYLLVAADGGVFVFGGSFWGSVGGSPINQPVVGMASREDGNGYWMVARDGGIFSFNAPFRGALAGGAQAPVVGMAEYGSL